MSRNRNRAKIHHTENTEIKKPDMPKPTLENKNPLGISFVVSTEVVYLPSGGNFYEEDNPVKGIEFLEIRHMTAKEEDILTNQGFINQGTVFDKLIDSIITTPGIQSRDLLDCDKMAVLACARKTGYGDILTLTETCANCGHVQDHEISLGEFLERAKDNPYKIKDGEYWSYNESSGTISVSLNVVDVTVDIKILSKRDFEYLQQAKKQKEKHNLPHSDTIEFLRLAIVSANGITDPTTLNNLVEVLPTSDARRIKIAHNSSLPVFDTKTTITCQSCSAETEKEVPFSVGWFWS